MRRETQGAADSSEDDDCSKHLVSCLPTWFGPGTHSLTSHHVQTNKELCRV